MSSMCGENSSKSKLSERPAKLAVGKLIDPDGYLFERTARKCAASSPHR